MTQYLGKIPLFINREKPLLELKKIFEQVDIDKAFKIVVVRGDFGIGKSALIENFINSIKLDRKNLIVGKAFCSPQTQQSSLAPFKDILIDLANNEPRAKLIMGVLVNFLLETAPAWADIVTGGSASKIKDAIAKTIEYGREMGVTKYSNDNVFAQFSNVIKKLSEKYSLVLYIDDLQWADETSVGLITYLSKVISNRPILVITTLREGEIIHRGDYRDFATSLSNLIRNHIYQISLDHGINTQEYIQLRYPNNDFTEEFSTTIETMTEGHPFLLDELFSYWDQLGLFHQTIIDNKSYISIKDTIDLKEITTNLPISVTTTVQNRLQLMGQELKEIVMDASVEGVTFTAQVIADLVSIDENHLYDCLSELDKYFSLIHRDSETEIGDTILDIYRFAKTFYREIIYKDIDPGKRRLLHNRIANSLENIYINDAHMIASKLIYHYKEARNYEKSIGYSVIGAKFEQKNFGWIEAEKICEEGLSLCNKLAIKKSSNSYILELLMLSAKGLYICGKVKQANDRYNEILNIFRNIDISPEVHLELLFDFIDACEDLNQNSEAMRYISKVEEIISKYNFTGYYKNKFFVYKSWEFIRKGQNQQAINILKDVLKDLEGEKENSEILSKVYNSLGIASSNLGFLESWKYFTRSIILARKNRDYKTEEVALLNLTDDLLYYGRIAEAININNKAYSLASKIGDVDGEAYGLANKGRIELLSGNPKAAIHLLNESVLLLDKIGSNWNKSYVYSDLAVSHSLINDHIFAFKLIEKAFDYIDNDPFRLAYHTRAKAQIYCNSGQTETGHNLYEQVFSISRTLNDDYYLNDTMTEFADKLENIGEFAKANRLRLQVDWEIIKLAKEREFFTLNQSIDNENLDILIS